MVFPEGQVTEMTVLRDKVSVVIPNWNGMKWLPDCLAALMAQDYGDFKIIVVDNGSSDESPEFAEEHYPDIELIRFAHNLGFAAAVNAGIKSASSDYVALLNADTRPAPHWLSSLVNTMDRCDPKVWSLASKMLNMENPGIVDDAGDTFSWQGAAHKRGHDRPASEFDTDEEVLSPCAGAALYRRGILNELGGFDEAFFAYLEDVDLGLRARMRGYHCLYVPKAEVRHQGHGSNIAGKTYTKLTARNRILIFVKNVPFRLLIKHIFSIKYGQLYFFLAHKHPFSSIAGYSSFIGLLPHALRERRKNLEKRTLSIQECDTLLERSLGEPSLCKLVSKRLFR